MKDHRWLVVGLVAAAGLVASASSARAPEYQPDPAPTFLRVLNTLQADGRANGYRPLPELLADPAFESFRPELTVAGADIELAASRVTLVLSADRRAYQVAIVPTTGCRTSWFSSDAGVIYRGLPLGCQ
jgi:hypothetical protein